MRIYFLCFKKKFIKLNFISFLCYLSIAPVFAAKYEGPKIDSNYKIFSGDINGDGYTDIFMMAENKFVIISLDDLDFPIVIPPGSPSFLLISDQNGAYSLIEKPSPEIFKNGNWQSGTHNLIFGDEQGRGAGSVLIKSVNGDRDNFIVAMSTENGKFRLLSQLSDPSIAGGELTFFHNDVAGTPMIASDLTGNIIWKENFRPYGDKLNKQSASSNNKIWFAGKPFDDSTGLSYMGARYYDPTLGRFMGIDPADFDQDNPHSFNRYAYANNNPYKFVDPDGKSPVHIAAFIIGATIEAAVQHWGPEQRPLGDLNYKGIAIAGATAAITGGVGGSLAQAAIKGTIATKTAIGLTSLTGAATGAAGSAAGDLWAGKTPKRSSMAAAAAGGAIGAAVGAKIDNRAAAGIAALAKGAGVSNHIGEATRQAVNFGAAVNLGTTTGEAIGKSAADATTAMGARHTDAVLDLIRK